jgi:hypothetical protein
MEPPSRPVCVNDARAEEVIAYLIASAMAGRRRASGGAGPWLWMCT